MPMRTVVADDIEWTIWNVVPGSISRLEKIGVDLAFRSGWLVFDSGAQKRRLAPIPPGWDSLTDGELALLIGRAEPIPPKRPGPAPVVMP